MKYSLSLHYKREHEKCGNAFPPHYTPGSFTVKGISLLKPGKDNILATNTSLHELCSVQQNHESWFFFRDSSTNKIAPCTRLCCF